MTLLDGALSRKRGMEDLAVFLNKKSVKYGKKTSYGGSNVCDWKHGRKIKGERKVHWMPLWAALELSRLIHKNKKAERNFLSLMEKNVLGYKEYESGKPILSPILPVKVTPEFDSLLFHLMGDGCWGGKGKLASYRQIDAQNRENFYKKLKNIFGHFELNRYESEEEWKICIPSIFVRLIEKHYSLNTKNSRRQVPQSIMEKGSMFKLAGLLAFMVDEAHVGDSIEIYASNRPLLKSLRSICCGLGYTGVKLDLKARAGYRRHKINHYRLRISLNNVEKMLGHIQCISKEFPTCTLCSKQRYLELLARRRQLRRKKGQDAATKQEILRKLSDAEFEVKDLKKELLIGGQTIRGHLADLEHKNLVQKTGKKNGAFLWRAVKNQKSLSEQAPSLPSYIPS